MRSAGALLIGLAALAAAVAIAFRFLATDQEAGAAQAIAAKVATPGKAHAPGRVDARSIRECSDALGANPMGGPCIPRSMRHVPPDPGPQNDTTLAGIDSNKNGVRDDVERYIAANYGEPPQKMAYLMQYARAVAPFVESTFASPAEALSAAGQRMRATECGASLIGPPDRPFSTAEMSDLNKWLDAAGDVRRQYLSTPERLQRYIQNEQLLAGQSLKLEPATSSRAGCDFRSIETTQFVGGAQK